MASASASQNGVVGAVHLTREEIAARVAQLGAEALALYRRFLEAGHGDADFSGIIGMLRDMTER